MRVVAGGRIVQTKRVGIGGVAQISDVAAGAYSVFANGNEGIAAYGIYLGDEAHAVSNRVGLVPLRDAATVMNLIRTHSQGGPGGAADAGAADDAGSLAENGDFEVDADGSVKGQAVLPAPAGQPRAPLANHYVAFVRGGQVVAETHTDANGNFALTGVSSGIYSVAFAGPSGFGAYSTGVRQPDAHVQARVTRLQFVALLAGGGGGTVVPASPRDFGLFIQTAGAPSGTNPAQSAMGPGPGGFGGGGSGGGSGGGGGGGGGLLGALAGAGIGAGIGAALANQDNNNNPATPAMP